MIQKTLTRAQPPPKNLSLMTNEKPTTEKAPSRYKDTVILPKTEFPMKGNLPVTEPQTLERWQKSGLYQKIIAKNAAAKPFVMPDGPPYANGNIHIGHVLNKVLKDIVIKFRNMQGYKADFIPGWDCHGLPIELKVTSNLADKKNQLSKKEIRDLCRKEAFKWIDKQRDQFVRLGVLADWQNPYLTMQPEYEAQEIRVLSKIFKNGILFRGNKPVYWCPALQTALAAAEVEYHDHKSLSVYVKFTIDELSGELAKLKALKKPVSLVIWTTTPWTLPANFGIALNANFEYGAYDTGKEILILATELAETVSKEISTAEHPLSLTNPVATFKGAKLEKLKARHPFMDRDSLIILGDHVSLDAGTGAVHTSPGHGLDDYHVGLKYNLPVFSPVDPAGKYTNEVPQYVGQSIWKANPLIVEDLKKSGHLLGQKEIVHSYPHNPRSKTPLIFRATPQWFVRMDDEFQLRNKTLKAIEKDIRYFPNWGKARLQAMVTNTPDWCLSRQRIWGVPIPVFYCTSCQEPLAKAEIMERVAEQMSSTGKGIEAYFDLPIETFVGNEKCEKCGGKSFSRSEDILDVWFDSGCCHTSVQRARMNNEVADIYLEGSDQHRGWFQTSLISSIAAYEKPPFKALITHGFVNDAQGHKMSKSKGNVIDPAEVIKKYGAEILRLWVAHEDYGDDVTVSDEMFQRVAETYRRIRNTMRFLLGNLSDFDPDKNRVEFQKMPPLDRWALVRLNEVVAKTTAAYEEYDFFKIYHALNQFFTIELSATYLDVLKDRLYTGKPDGLLRRSSQTVFYELIRNLNGLLAPILSFLSEEVHQYLPGKKAESVFLSVFPTANNVWVDEALVKKFAVLIEVRAVLAKNLEELRQQKVIGSSLDAEAFISAKGETFAILNEFKDSLREYFIVSAVELKEGEFKAEARRARGDKCERCWHYDPDLGSKPDLPGVCPKCTIALS
jgi:isoleucyl-tRNA synthetase